MLYIGHHTLNANMGRILLPITSFNTFATYLIVQGLSSGSSKRVD